MESIREQFTRVTSIFSPYVSFDHINPVTLHNACERGTRVHLLCELHMLDEYFPEPDESLLGYLNSFRGWYDKMVDKLISTEQRIYNDELMLTGAIDIVCAIRGSTTPVIIDIKTPATESKTFRLQLAAYKYLYKHCHCCRKKNSSHAEKGWKTTESMRVY